MNRQEKRVLREQCGKKRKQNATRIRAFLLLNGHTLTSLAQQEGVTMQAVSNVLNGRKHTPRLLDAMLAAGAHAEDLADPRKVNTDA